MIKFNWIFGLFLTITSLSANCQENTIDNVSGITLLQIQNQAESARIEYKMNGVLERYVNFADSLDREKLKNQGYRIQLFSNSGPSAKENAVKFQSSFLRLYEKTPSYTLWNYPNWVVRVGDFGTKLEALEFHNAIRELYPASFIVSDEINVKY